MSKSKGEREYIFRIRGLSTLIFIAKTGTILCVLLSGVFFPRSAHSFFIAQADTGTSGVLGVARSSEEETPEAINTYLRKARDFFRDGRYNEAIECWNEVLLLKGDNKEAKDGLEAAKVKIAKINDFFGRDVFDFPEDITQLSLRDCLDMAEERSLIFQIAKEQIGLAKIKVWEARRSFLPSLTLSYSRTRGDRDGKLEGVEYGMEGRQPAFRSGELIHSLGQSKANLKIAEKNYDQAKMELYYEVAEAYYNFVKAKKFREYIKNIYGDVKPLYRMTHEKHENGLVADIEFLGSESKFNQIYYQSIAADNEYDLARLALEQTMNMKNIGVIDVNAEYEHRAIDKDMDACLEIAMENRPDLKMSEFTVKSTDYGKKIAQARGLPQVDLTGYYKKASEVVEPSELDPHKKWYAGVEATWPFHGSTGSYSAYKKEDTSTISAYYAGSMSKGTMLKLGVLDNMKQFSENQEAEIANMRAKEELNEIRKTVIMEVKEAFYGYERARIQMEAAEAQKIYREKEYDILEVKHSIGEAELSELFESMISLAGATEVYMEAEKDLNVSIAALNKAMGIEEYF